MNALQIESIPVRCFPGTIRAIMFEVMAKYDVTEQDLLADLRIPKIVRARHEWFYRCLTEAGKSRRAIARASKHHRSTVTEGIRTHAIRNGMNGGIPC